MDNVAGPSPQREVGKMGFLMFAIIYLVLGVVAVMKPRVGHA
jgi:hypothetical protein